MNGPWTPSTGWHDARLMFDRHAGKQPSLEHWGQCWECSFDSSVAEQVVARGDIPVLDWGTGHISGYAPDAAVASGKYDDQLATQAQALASFGHPIFLLFDEEMNGTWHPFSPGQNGNTAADFVAMWRHVHDILRTQRRREHHLGLGPDHRRRARSALRHARLGLPR